MTGPWAPLWNYQFFEVLFRLIRPTAKTNDLFEFLIANPLISTWIFAAVFYRYWTKEDDQKSSRRTWLTKSLMAVAIAVVITLVMRPWISWPAPVLHPFFRDLFQPYLWSAGSTNCFPSHSTLVYFTVAMGFWPLNRRLSSFLMFWTVFLVSFPRIYVGGHYPVDVLFSCLLGPVVLAMVWRLPMPVVAASWCIEGKRWVGFRDSLLFLWIFELGEAFRSAESLIHVLQRWPHWH